MRVLQNYFVLCVWQFNLVISAGVNLPITSIAYKAMPINPKSLSLSFSTNDSVESKIPNNLEDLNFKPIETSVSTQDEELSKQTVSVSRLLSKLGLISDNDSALKDLNFSKQKENFDPKIINEVAAPQKNLSYLKTNIKEKSDIPKNQENKKNTVNYNIKVISPPAVFNSLPISLPMTPNVAANNNIYGPNKYSNYVMSNSLLSYPVRCTKESKKKSDTAWPNGKKSFSNSDDVIKNMEPLVQKNITCKAEHNQQQINNIVRNDNIMISPKDIAKYTDDLNVHKSPFNIDTPSENVDDLNNNQIPIKFLETSYFNHDDILPTMSDVITINQEITPSLLALSNHDAESNKINDNLSSFNQVKDKSIPKQFLIQNIPSNTLLCYVPNILPPTLPQLSHSKVPEFSKQQQIYTNDCGTCNLHLGSMLDKMVSFLTSKFIFAFSDISAANSSGIPSPLGASDLLLPQITKVAPVKLSETPAPSLPEVVSSYPEVESPSYLPKPNIDILIKDINTATKKTITKPPVPYISSVTINYMPCIESSNEIIIFV